MKVNIGPYINRWVSNVYSNHMNKKYGYVDWPENQTRYETFLEHVDSALQWIYNNTINRFYLDRKERRVKIKIHKYDTWSMDYTLAPIILPMLKQLKDTKHGAPLVDDEDVPEELKSTGAPPKENEWDTDDNHFKRWDWVLDEMIWAFEQKCRDHWEEDYYGPFIEVKGEQLGGHFEWVDDKGRQEHQNRMSNAFKLFGKYYEALWD